MNTIRFYFIFISIMMIGIVGCTTLESLENRAGAYTTNTVIITNTSSVQTNITVITNIVQISDTFYQTNIYTNINTIWTNTNYIKKSVSYQPIPNVLTIYVDQGAYATWVNPQVHWWYIDGSGSGDLTKISNLTKGSITWWVFKHTNLNFEKQFAVKVNDDGTTWEPIKSENGDKYDRVVTLPILTKETATTNTVGDTNEISTEYQTYDKIFVFTPGQWYESFPYLMEYETNIYKNPAPEIVLDDQYMGANYWGSGATFFTLYAPNVRRVWVGGDFNNWTETPMNLSLDKKWWWVYVDNTLPDQKYKFAIEKYRWTNHHWMSDPAAKKNEYSPAMDTEGNRSYIIDQSKYQWGDGAWGKPGFEYYNIYQLHIRTFCTQGDEAYYGWGTFTSATNKFDYIKDLGFTAIEPLPIQEFAGDMSWGYNYVLFYAPETAYTASLESVDSLKLFVDTAHQKGMAVILDLVFNHMGASDDVLGGLDPSIDWNNPQTYWYSGKTDWGPKFNYANPMVQKFLTDSAIYFVQHYHVDGFRFDATAFMWGGDTGSPGGSFLYNMTREIKSRMGSDVILIAENLPVDDWITGDGGFDRQWNADSAHTLKKLFTDGPGAVSMDEIETVINWSIPGVNYLVSHDEAANGKQRTAADLHYTRSWGNDEYDAQYQQLTGLATVFMAKGIPMMLQGDEFLEGFYNDSYWGPPYNSQFFVDSKPLSWNADYYDRSDGWPNRWRAGATAQATKDLMWIRRNNAAIRYYDISVYHKNNTDKVIGFLRGGNIYVVINYNKQSHYDYNASIPSGTWNLEFASPSGTYGDSGFDGSLTGTAYGGGNINIPEYGVLIYKKQ